MDFKKLTLSVAFAFAAATTANATVISTNASASSTGALAEIIAAPASVLDDATTNDAIQAFDEIQNYILGADLTVDSGTILKGTRVSSHMVFLNTKGSKSVSHGFGNSAAATFTFDGAILGVMSDSNGNLETATSSFLGSLSTIYPAVGFNARGLEDNPLVGTNNDYYSFAGDTLTIGMKVTEPGDWIRVVTAANVPVPAAAWMLGLALAGLGGVARRRKAA